VEWKSSIYREYAGYKLRMRQKKVVGKPYEGEPHVRFEVAGAGNGFVGIPRQTSTLPSPSQDDLFLTNRLKEAGDVLGITVIDHVVLGYPNYVSLKEMGQI
jgi:hypothetical protein